jgi:hypothetical protein
MSFRLSAQSVAIDIRTHQNVSFCYRKCAEQIEDCNNCGITCRKSVIRKFPNWDLLLVREIISVYLSYLKTLFFAKLKNIYKKFTIYYSVKLKNMNTTVVAFNLGLPYEKSSPVAAFWGDNFSPRMPCKWYVRGGGEGKRRILIGQPVSPSPFGMAFGRLKLSPLLHPLKKYGK